MKYSNQSNVVSGTLSYITGSSLYAGTGTGGETVGESNGHGIITLTETNYFILESRVSNIDGTYDYGVQCNYTDEVYSQVRIEDLTTSSGSGSSEKGQKGDAGAAASKGQKGDAGAAASKGQKGQQGVQGTPGVDADKGQKGQQGVQGTPGLDADKGQKGQQGTPGLDADKGQKGQQGASGLDAEKGQKGEAGEFEFTVVNKTAGYGLQGSDAGKFITNNNNFGVYQNTHSVGDVITLHNKSSGNITIFQNTGVTLRFAGSAITGNRILTQRGTATLICIASNEFIISGSGLL